MAKKEIPPVLYRIAEMIVTRERWDGTMSQLLEEIGEQEVTPNALSRKIAQYGSLVFDPMMQVSTSIRSVNLSVMQTNRPRCTTTVMIESRSRKS